MTNDLKEFIEQNIDIVDNNDWKKLFIKAYDEALTTAEVIELHNILLEARIVDSTQIRNDLLFDHIKGNLDFVRAKYKLNAGDPNEMTVSDTYAAQFLRVYLNNTFGFSEREVLHFMWDNQRAFGIKLEPVDTTMITNYKIHYEL